MWWSFRYIFSSVVSSHLFCTHMVSLYFLLLHCTALSSLPNYIQSDSVDLWISFFVTKLSKSHYVVIIFTCWAATSAPIWNLVYKNSSSDRAAHSLLLFRSTMHIFFIVVIMKGLFLYHQILVFGQHWTTWTTLHHHSFYQWNGHCIATNVYSPALILGQGSWPPPTQHKTVKWHCFSFCFNIYWTHGERASIC